jgi:hypothetical protein
VIEIHRGYLIQLSRAFTMDESFAVDEEMIAFSVTRQDDGHVWHTGVYPGSETHTEVVAMLKRQIDAHLGHPPSAGPDRRAGKPPATVHQTRT